MKEYQILTISFKMINVSIVCLFVLSVSSCFNEQQINDYDLGVSVEVPNDWRVEKSDKAQILELVPNHLEENEAPVSITMLGSVNYNEDLIVAMDTEVKRIQQILSPGEIVVIQEAEQLEGDKYEAAHVELLVLLESDSSGSNNRTLNQPIDLIMIRGRNQQLIVLQVRKSHTNEALNAQIDEIIHSIVLIDTHQLNGVP